MVMRDYACLMLDYTQPEFIREIQKKIPEDELYLGQTKKEIESDEYGIEHECHITIAYGLENNVKFDDLKKYLYPLNDYKTILINVSVFKNENFDVLKVEAKCPMAKKSNKQIADNFDLHTEFKDYKAHMTIAYMKKGMADKYKKDVIDKIEDLTPIDFTYSYYKDDDQNVIEKYKSLD